MTNVLKQQLRTEYLAKLKTIDQDTRNQWNQEILQKFITSDYFSNNQVFALYWSLSHEVDTHQIIKVLLDAKKKICLPRIKDKQLIFYYVDDISQLIVDNKFNIAQPPVTNQLANVQDIDLFIVPLLAFDDNNYRLGYGGGFYDSFFSNNFHKMRIGLGYKMQLITKKTSIIEPWDLPLLAIITNK